jgi:predicted nucleic acid-binding protein
VRKFVLDTNCFIAASCNDEDAAKFEAFVHMAAPGLYLSTVVAAELRAGTIRPRDVQKLERAVLKPYYRRGRIINPSAAAWDALGKTLAWLVRNEGIDLRAIRRSFIFDILLAYSCRELGAVLISGNEQDLRRIRRVFSFEFVVPYPHIASKRS